MRKYHHIPSKKRSIHDRSTKGEKTYSLYEKFNFGATYILAIVAILGFIISIQTSKQTSDSLDKITRNLFNFTVPVISFSDYHWISHSQLSCTNFPLGINVSYKNGSNVPIKIEQAELQLLWKDMVLNPPVPVDSNSIYYGTETSILAPGELFSSSQIDSGFGIAIYKATKLKDVTFIKVHFTALISNMNNINRYKLDYVHYIQINCTDWYSKNFTIVKENLSPVSENYPDDGI